MKSIWNWFRGSRKPKTLLKGAPVHARTKTYSAETGYVYQYVFKGYRSSPDPPGSDFVFAATHDRKEHFDVTIRLLDSTLAACAERIGRALLSTERYALAKMALFQAFDECEPGKLTDVLVPDAGQMEAHLQTLDRI